MIVEKDAGVYYRKNGPDESIKRTRIPYNRDPDFSRPMPKIPPDVRKRMLSRLAFLYGESEAEKCLPELERILKVHHAFKPQELIDAEKGYDPRERFTEKDMVLITYGDAFKGEKGETLAALHQTVQTHNQGAINTIHILPFFPYSSDRGFAVVDFKSVDPKMGTWEYIREMDVDYDLMFDGVMNHCSSRSQMFQEFLQGNPRFQDFFIAYDSPDDLTPDQRSKIFRPRTSDILTRFDTLEGEKWVWTTFSTVSPDVFTVLRTSPEGDERILTMTNVTPRQTRVEIPVSESGVRETHWLDLINEKEWMADGGKLKVTLEPYDVIWLKALAESKG